MRTPLRVLVFLVLAMPARAGAEKVTIDEDTFFNIGTLIQPQFTLTENAAPDGGVGMDFYLRRARIVLTGQFDPHILFLFVTDQPNWGRNGDFASSAFIVQDAAAIYKVGPQLTISAGFILLPFTRHGLQGAGALNTVDYRAAVIRFPPTGRAFRDMGVELRGLVARDRIYYRAGIFSGMNATDANPGINPGDAPRLTGMLRFNILGKEDAYALPGISFGTDPLVSVGVGFDWQRDAFGNNSEARYLALAGDVFLDYPLPGDQELAAQATVIRYDRYLAGAGPDEAIGFLVEGGYRFMKIEPVAALEYFNGEAPGSKVINIKVGLNYWFAKHNYNLKAELTIPNNEAVDGVTPPENLLGILQAQVSF